MAAHTTVRAHPSLRYREMLPRRYAKARTVTATTITRTVATTTTMTTAATTATSLQDHRGSGQAQPQTLNNDDRCVHYPAAISATYHADPAVVLLASAAAPPDSMVYALQYQVYQHVALTALFIWAWRKTTPPFPLIKNLSRLDHQDDRLLGRRVRVGGRGR